VALLITAISSLSLPMVANAETGKVQFAISNPEIALGESATVDVTLDEPIICIEALECSVTLDFTDSIPDGITVSPASISWSGAEWSQPRTITVTVAEDASELFAQTITLGGILASASEYYQGYQAGFDVNVPAPEGYNQRNLANTGSNQGVFGFQAWGAILILLCGLGLVRLARR
jgi:hypothetical protein